MLYPVKTLCRILDVHRSSYRYWCRPNVLDVELTVKRSLVSEAFNVSGGSAGARSIATMVNNTHGVKLVRWLAGKLMKNLNFVSCQNFLPHSRKHKYKSEGDEPVDILLNRQFSVTGTDQVWCGDVTYIWVGSRWAYLAVVFDLFARKPVGWAMSFSPDSQLTIRALQMAWELLGHHKLMFHSVIKEAIIPVVSIDRHCGVIS